MNKIKVTLYDIAPLQQSRWIPGDSHIRKLVRALLRPIRGSTPGGLTKVTNNLVRGIQKLGIPYELHKSSSRKPQSDIIGVLNGPIEKCRELCREYPSLTGPGILNSALQWPELFSETQSIFHLQNCKWAADMYRRHYGERVRIWTMGIDEERYAPRSSVPKKYDFLLYDKIRWPEAPTHKGLLQDCKLALEKAGCSYQYIRYGQYPRGRESSYHDMLGTSRAMLYLSENETQGFAYNEALSMNVPILAWNIGKWCDPLRFSFGLDEVPATSVPYWDERCGLTFSKSDELPDVLGTFLENLNSKTYSPREFILENLTLEHGAKNYFKIITEAREYV